VPTAVLEQPVFYYDLGSPDCYLLAETISSTLPVVPEWEPVLGSDIADDARASECAALEDDAARRQEIERRAAALGLQPVRWPGPWPPATKRAMLAATYAKHIGRVVAFSLAAFRQAFAGGRDLGDEDTILIAGAACEMHPRALRKAIGLAGTQTALDDAGRRALAANVTSLPAIQVGARVFVGAAAIGEATAALEQALP
jgi:2-hydroxychromene-2-carboxylate isomerase